VEYCTNALHYIRTRKHFPRFFIPPAARQLRIDHRVTNGSVSYPVLHKAEVSTGFVESTVNQVISKRFCKKQQMQWTKRGAHLLLQTRVKTLNQELGTVFQRWYPDLQLEEEPLAA
jgi:hypothetical protein